MVTKKEENDITEKYLTINNEVLDALLDKLYKII